MSTFTRRTSQINRIHTISSEPTLYSEHLWKCDICGLNEGRRSTASRALESLIVISESFALLYAFFLFFVFFRPVCASIVHSCVFSISVAIFYTPNMGFPLKKADFFLLQFWFALFLNWVSLLGELSLALRHSTLDVIEIWFKISSYVFRKKRKK